jgi:uncharacterized membrane protein HdeD (DUF308 family)
MTEQTDVAHQDVVEKSWKWLLFIGILTTILGFVGLAMGVMMTIVSILYFGFMVIFGGMLHLFNTPSLDGWKNKLLAGLIGILYIVSGMVIISYPAASASWFTLFIAAFLMVSGIFRIIAGSMSRDELKGWGWMVFSGVLALVLGGMIYAQWPYSGLWVIGLFVSLELLMQGFAMLSVAMATRSLQRQAA